MVDASRKDLKPVSKGPLQSTETYNQVILHQLDAHPLVALAPHIEEACAVPDVPNLLVLVQVLIEERLHLLLVDVAHLLRGHGNNITVLVAAILGELVDICNVGESVVENSQLGQVFFGDLPTGVMELALVNALGIVSLVKWGRGRLLTASLSYQYALILTVDKVEDDGNISGR